MRSDVTANWVRTAHADAWQAIGEQFARHRGARLSSPGLRLMASGLPNPQWNAGDVTSQDADVTVAERFYSSVGVPWALRVPDEMLWPHGRRVVHLRLMGLRATEFIAASPSADASIRVAGAQDRSVVTEIDAAAFGGDPGATSRWFGGLLEAPDEQVCVCLATVQGRAVGTGYCVHTNDVAGPSVYLAGVAVRPEARRRGVGLAISSWLVSRGLAAGAEFAHLQPDDDRAARLYERLGFVETAGLDVYEGRPADPKS